MKKILCFLVEIIFLSLKFGKNLPKKKHFMGVEEGCLARTQ
jgi:hypothetical protein